MDIKEEEALGRTLDKHWYYQSKGLALDRILGGLKFDRVLDIGAGSGIFAKRLLRGNAISATCVDPAYPQDEREESYQGKSIRFVRQIGAEKADLVLLMDVLEHVDDDIGLLKSATENAPSGAHVLITVPAFQGLFSAHDLFLDHKRRYTLAQVEKVVGAAGLKVVSGRYFFGMLLPVAATVRMLQRQDVPKSNLKESAKIVNAILTWVHYLELPFFWLNRVGGLTVFCLARKP